MTAKLRRIRIGLIIFDFLLCAAAFWALIFGPEKAVSWFYFAQIPFFIAITYLNKKLNIYPSEKTLKILSILLFLLIAFIAADIVFFAIFIF